MVRQRFAPIMCCTLLAAVVVFVQGMLPSLCAKDLLPQRTALDEYVAKPDASYRWEIVADTSKSGLRTIVVDMVSQTWRTPDEVDRTEWQHWLTISIPEDLEYDTGLLFIGGGKNGGKPPSGPSEIIQSIARSTHSVAAELRMIPNQPLVFHQDGQLRVEDDLIGYTWDQYVKTGDPTWPARNPMVKSAVRAMDTILAITKDKSIAPHEVTKFVVAGGSKRGWTTWLTGAVDQRVVAIIPIVIDVLNVRLSMQHHFAAYGFWAPAIGNYVEHGITQKMDDPRMQDLYKLVDPYWYRHRLTIPKFIVNAAGDQFFLPDSSQFYFDDLRGQKNLRYVPNADHSLDDSDGLESIIAFYTLVLQGKPTPKFTWVDDPDGSIRVLPETKPMSVRLWHATNPIARDFRLESLGAKYKSTTLSPQENGYYVGEPPTSKSGWTAYFVELTYDVGAIFPLKMTTSVRVTPDLLPHQDSDPSLPPSITLRCQVPNDGVAEQVKKASQSSIIESFTDAMRCTFERSDGEPRTIWVRLNWTPKGRFRVGAERVRDWLQERGCTEFQAQFESGEK